MDNITWGDIISLITTASIIIGIIAGICTLKRNKKLDTDSNTKEAALKASTEASHSTAVLVELGYIKRSVDDFKKVQEEQVKQNQEVLQRLTIVEESTKSAHKRIDEIKK
jgi:hypothetical protein